jgi:2,3-bisphosphoglycerate-dependent phosphoglycerate mutase
MKRSFLLLAVFFCGIAVHAQSPLANAKIKIYLVRHGEKETGKDPGLTAAGRQRAGDLMRKMKNKKIRRIYVTEYRRTQMTGDSMRIQMGIDTVHYAADTTGEDLLKKIMQHGDTRHRILVIGHSNTIPPIIRKLGVLDYPQEYIADKEFDNLFLVRYKRHKAHEKKDKYGAASATSAAMKSL